jgi:hypothetical protein
LQSLTIWDPEVVVPVVPPRTASRKEAEDDVDVHEGTTATTLLATAPTALLEEPSPFSFRAKFLAKFQKGLQAEVKTRNLLSQQAPSISGTTSSNDVSTGSALKPSSRKTSSFTGATQVQQKQWAREAAMNDQRKHRIREAIVEQAFDDAVQQHEQQQGEEEAIVKTPMKKNPNRYQFVGVINSHPNPNRRRKNVDDTATTTLPPITWYTRPKPKHAQWTIRLIHVNRAAILKDLYNQKKIDIFAQYQNEGTRRRIDSSNQESDDANTNQRPVVTGQYRVRERSWKNLWNMSLKHMFTDSSGMYWRERRIHSMQENDLNHQQLYTDGEHVYEATYRYMPDGRNGMHKVSTLNDFLNSRSIDPKMKQGILQRLQQDTPDIVLEE